MASHSASSGHPSRENAHKRRVDKPSREYERYLAHLRGMRDALNKLEIARTMGHGGDSPLGASSSIAALSEAPAEGDAVIEGPGDESLEALLTNGREKVNNLVNGLQAQRRVETLARLSHRFEKCARSADETRKDLMESAVAMDEFDLVAMKQLEDRRKHTVEHLKQFREDLHEAVHGAALKRTDSARKRKQVQASGGPGMSEDGEMRHIRRLEAVVHELQEQISRKDMDGPTEADRQLAAIEAKLEGHRKTIARMDKKIDCWRHRRHILEDVNGLFHSKKVQAAGDNDEDDSIAVQTREFIKQLKKHVKLTRAKQIHHSAPDITLLLGEEKSLIEEKARLAAELAELREKTDDIASCMQLLSGDVPDPTISQAGGDDGEAKQLREELFEMVQDEKRQRAKLQDLQVFHQKICERRQLGLELKEKLVDNMKDTVKNLFSQKPPPEPKGKPKESSEPINWNRSRWGGPAWDAAVQTPEIYAWCMWPQLLGVRRQRRRTSEADPDEEPSAALSKISHRASRHKSISVRGSIPLRAGSEQDMERASVLRQMPNALNGRQRLMWNTLDILKSVLAGFQIDQPEVCGRILSRMSTVEVAETYAEGQSPAVRTDSAISLDGALPASPAGSFALGRMPRQPQDSDSSQASPAGSRSPSKIQPTGSNQAFPTGSGASGLVVAEPSGTDSNGVSPTGSKASRRIRPEPLADSTLVSPAGGRHTGKMSLQLPADSPQASWALAHLSSPQGDHVVGRLSLQLPGSDAPAPSDLVEAGRLSLTAPSLPPEEFNRQQSSASGEKSLEYLAPASASNASSQRPSPTSSTAFARLSTKQRMSMNQDMLDQTAALYTAQIDKLTMEHQKHEELCNKIKAVRGDLQKAFPKPGRRRSSVK